MTLVHDPDLDALWAAHPVERRRGPDRSDERSALIDLAKGQLHGLTALVDRHGDAVWRFAAVITLDDRAATEVSVAAWAQVVDEAGELLGLTWPFRWEVLRRVQAIAAAGRHGGAAPNELAPEHVPPPFAAVSDPAMVAVAFCQLTSTQRSILWLTEIERIPARDTAPLLGISSIASAETVQRAAVEMLGATVDAQFETSTGRCASTVERFLAYLDGTLIDTDVEVLHRHLRACADCSRRLDAAEDPAGVLLERLAPPPGDLTAQVAERLHDTLRTARYS